MHPTETLPDGPNEVDLALRAVTALFARELAASLVGEGVTESAWIETQLASRERRLDRLLAVTVNGARRWLHVEWMLAWSADLPWRMFEYHAMAAMAAHGDAVTRQQEARAQGRDEALAVAGVESALVLLTGRASPAFANEMAYCTTPDGTPWSGVRFRVEAVHQRTIEELRALGRLWLMFAPLAVDATEASLRAVVEELRETMALRSFAELAAAMIVLSDADGRERGLRHAITSCLTPEIEMQSTYLQTLRSEAKAVGKAEGKAEGEQRAILAILDARKLSVPPEVRAQIEGCSDLATLDGWVRRALTVKTARALVRPARKPPESA